MLAEPQDYEVGSFIHFVRGDGFEGEGEIIDTTYFNYQRQLIVSLLENGEQVYVGVVDSKIVKLEPDEI